MGKAALILCLAAMVVFLAQPGHADSDENCKCLDITFNDGSTGKSLEKQYKPFTKHNIN